MTSINRGKNMHKIDNKVLSKPRQEGVLPEHFFKKVEVDPPIETDPPGETGKSAADPDKKSFKVQMSPDMVNVLVRTPYTVLKTFSEYPGFDLTPGEEKELSYDASIIIEGFIPEDQMKWFALGAFFLSSSSLLIKKGSDWRKYVKEEKNKRPEVD